VIEADISFIFPLFIVHRHSDLKVPCSNLSVDERFYLQKKHTLGSFLFRKVYQ
jgi:hypothetical protein